MNVRGEDQSDKCQAVVKINHHLYMKPNNMKCFKTRRQSREAIKCTINHVKIAYYPVYFAGQ